MTSKMHFTSRLLLSHLADAAAALATVRADIVVRDANGRLSLYECKRPVSSRTRASAPRGRGRFESLFLLAAAYDLGKGGAFPLARAASASGLADEPAHVHMGALVPAPWSSTGRFADLCCTPEPRSAWALSAPGLIVALSASVIAEGRGSIVRLIDHVIRALRLTIVRLLAALSSRPQAGNSILTMLAAIRHYGHRDDPHARLLTAFVLNRHKRRGAGCLVA